MVSPLRPCPTCRTPVPNGLCARHPPTSRQYRPGRRSHTTYRDSEYRTNRLLILAAYPTCTYCLSSHSTTADHVIPRSKGGGSHLGNLTAACGLCNTGKKDRTLLEWIATGCAPQGAKQLAAQRQQDGLPC